MRVHNIHNTIGLNTATNVVAVVAIEVTAADVRDVSYKYTLQVRVFFL